MSECTSHEKIPTMRANIFNPRFNENMIDTSITVKSKSVSKRQSMRTRAGFTNRDKGNAFFNSFQNLDEQFYNIICELCI